MAGTESRVGDDKQLHLKPIIGHESPDSHRLHGHEHHHEEKMIHSDKIESSSQCHNRQYDQIIDLISKALDIDKEAVYEVEGILNSTERQTTVGLLDEFISGQRLDNLCMCYCSLVGLLNSLDAEPSLTTGSTVRLISLFDHEEIGSVTAQGARSDFLPSILRRLSRTPVSRHSEPLTSPYEKMMARSFLISADMAHGFNPNFANKYDDLHSPKLNGGPVLKINANMKYATSTPGLALLRLIADNANVPLQLFVVNNNSSCGTIIGPLLASTLGMRTVDMGLAQWSMHSIRETAGARNLAMAVDLFKAIFTKFEGS